MNEMKVFKDNFGWVFVLPDFVDMSIGPASCTEDEIYSLEEIYEDLINQKENAQTEVKKLNDAQK
jgi:hypothetical protein